MVKSTFALLGLAGLLASCQQTPTTNATGAPTISATTDSAATPTPTAGAQTEPAARAAVARYIQTLPNATLYVPDSARAIEVDTHWQVLVPRTDWAKRMPNKAAFEVDKATGTVTTRPVK
ncbi:hypothetical protein GO988_01660 [Hymenobacter sp. HMF4947]|uniref:Uncharacterized protein n=1 Tax=Hymenobacter ginkgonis TaxID=2682976 RepID=A0A7K1T9F1_9BACT|nr:hypothetical protein [Hymenobacter ginkgonis]MVN75025.1 hypothetical protein [Hymenobacter ginkgonis]